MRFYDGCTALITGASSGFGEQFARQLAPVADTLVLVARREDLLEELKRELEGQYPGLRVCVYVLDLRDEAKIPVLIQWLRNEKIHVNFLINNAGLGDKGVFATSDWAKVRAILEVNIVALTHLTHALLPMLREGGRGAILNVSSIAGLLPLPRMAVYAATKAYVNSFNDALRMELRDTGITVTAVLPGPSETEFNRRAARPGDATDWNAPGCMLVPAEDVVHRALMAVACDRARVIPGWKVALLMGLAVALPLGILRALLQRRSD